MCDFCRILVWFVFSRKTSFFISSHMGTQHNSINISAGFIWLHGQTILCSAGLPPSHDEPMFHLSGCNSYFPVSAEAGLAGSSDWPLQLPIQVACDFQMWNSYQRELEHNTNWLYRTRLAVGSPTEKRKFLIGMVFLMQRYINTHRWLFWYPA